MMLQDAVSDIDELYEETESGEVVKKPYDDVRKIFESNFEELEKLCINEVYHNSPIVMDDLLWNFGMSKKVSMLYCYGLYCIDRALRGYFLNHTGFSSQTFSYGVSAIEAAKFMKLLSMQDFYALRSNSSKAGKAKAARYQPLKDLARELVEKGNYKSRRNAANQIAPKILDAGSKLNPPVVLSKQQAELTITGWLKEMGLPANI